MCARIPCQSLASAGSEEEPKGIVRVGLPTLVALELGRLEPAGKLPVEPGHLLGAAGIGLLAPGRHISVEPAIEEGAHGGPSARQLSRGQASPALQRGQRLG